MKKSSIYYTNDVMNTKTEIACDKGILRYLISVGDQNPRHATSAQHLQRNFFSEQGKNIIEAMGALHFDKEGLQSILQMLELVEE